MLSPEYLAACVSILLGMMDEINYAVMADIARRLVKTDILTESAEFQTERLMQNGLTLKEIQHTVSNLSNLTESEVRRIFDEANLENMESENLRAAIAGKTPLDHSANTAMANLLASHIRKTVGDVRNLTRTTASQGQDSFFRACTLANMQVSSGAFTYDFAIKNAIRQVAKEGLKVQYPTGHVDKLDVAVRRAVLTGVNQSAAELNMMYADEIGADLVEVTAHMGARPSHAVWQGGIYSRSGKNSSYPSFIESTGYGTGDGLCGWNCRHSFHAYYEGSPRTYSKEYLENLDKDVYEYRDKTYTNYEAGQKQRAYERAIREEKRYLAGLNAAYKETTDQALKISLRADMESSAVRLKRTEANMKIFCKATNRMVDNVRTQVYAVKDPSGKIVGFDKSAAQRARQLAKARGTTFNEKIVDVIQGEFGRLRTAEVILRAERVLHIQKRHLEALETIIKFYRDLVETPDFILKDKKNPDTIINIKSIEGENFLVVIKLNVESNLKNRDYKNSIITGQLLNKKRLCKYINKHKVLYKKE